MAEYKHIRRNFGPVYDSDSRILILGSFPSVKSREAAFYYGHPQNRFWPLLGRLLGSEVPEDILGRTKLLLRNQIALWDTIEECDVAGSSDSSIRNVVPVDIRRILDAADICVIFCNGGTSFRMFMKHLYPVCGITPVQLPSTSPANAAWTAERLYEAWRAVTAFLPTLPAE